ncbi:hypothetical protein EHS86_16795 [Erwinia amylovora]|nr:hypothetical protein EHS86_16795 [Erwinia amylovora]
MASLQIASERRLHISLLSPLLTRVTFPWRPFPQDDDRIFTRLRKLSECKGIVKLLREIIILYAVKKSFCSISNGIN